MHSVYCWNPDFSDYIKWNDVILGVISHLALSGKFWSNWNVA